MTDDEPCRSLCGRLIALETLVAAMRRETEIMVKEVDRRLEILNGEAERLRVMQATYLPREVAETKIDTLRAVVDELRSGRDKDIGRLSVFAGVISVVVSLAVGWIILQVQ